MNDKHKCFSRDNIIDLFVSLFPNKKILDEFSELDATLLYKGKPIEGASSGTSDHEKKVINSAEGIHGIRYYSNKLQYYNNAWVDITTGTNSKDITISPTKNNALTKLSNGYYVQSFLISKQANNALVKYSDGYYVPEVPLNMATTEDIKKSEDSLKDIISELEDDTASKHELITQKINDIAGIASKYQEHNFTGNNASLNSVADISTLYNANSDVILNSELMIQNVSNASNLTLQIIEHGMITMETVLTPKEVQKYKLSNTVNISFNILGEYSVYLYINYL